MIVGFFHFVKGNARLSVKIFRSNYLTLNFKEINKTKSLVKNLMVTRLCNVVTRDESFSL